MTTTTLTLKHIARDLFSPLACAALADYAEEQGADRAAADWRTLASAPEEALAALGSLPTLASAFVERQRSRHPSTADRLHATAQVYGGWTDGSIWLPSASLSAPERAAVTRRPLVREAFAGFTPDKWRQVYPLHVVALAEPDSTRYLSLPCSHWTVVLSALANPAHSAILRADRFGLLMRRYPLCSWYSPVQAGEPLLLAPDRAGPYSAALMPVG